MASSEGSATPPVDKGLTTHIEQITTREQVPGHTNYYEKNGLRTYGDGESELAALFAKIARLLTSTTRS